MFYFSCNQIFPPAQYLLMCLSPNVEIVLRVSIILLILISWWRNEFCWIHSTVLFYFSRREWISIERTNLLTNIFRRGMDLLICWIKFKPVPIIPDNRNRVGVSLIKWCSTFCLLPTIFLSIFFSVCHGSLHIPAISRTRPFRFLSKL